MNILALYLYAINIVAFVMMYIDKKNAINKLPRISELAFFITSIIGGGVGIIIGVYNFEHKTRKKLFTLIIPIIALITALLFSLLFIKKGV